jgi:hypothetical protein
MTTPAPDATISLAELARLRGVSEAATSQAAKGAGALVDIVIRNGRSARVKLTDLAALGLVFSQEQINAVRKSRYSQFELNQAIDAAVINALQVRDAQWREWKDGCQIARYANPNGPPYVHADFVSLTTLAETQERTPTP